MPTAILVSGLQVCVIGYQSVHTLCCGLLIVDISRARHKDEASHEH